MANLLLVATLSFAVSLIFGLGGLGSAVALIPILVFIGIPFTTSRTVGLFVNFISTSSITMHNVKAGKLNYRLCLPIILSSIAFAPVGAYASFTIPEKEVGRAFTLFLFFAGTVTLSPVRRALYRDDLPTTILILVGCLAGFISGLLGVGGGGVISPLLILCGLNPRTAIVITAFSVPSSSFTSFLTYLKLGAVDWIILLSASIPAIVSGYFAGHIGRSLKIPTVRRILGIIFYIIAIKFAMKFF